MGLLTLIITFSSVCILLGGILIVFFIKYRRTYSLINSDDSLFFYITYKPKRKLLYINKTCEAFCGYTAKEFYGNQNLFSKLIHPEDYPLFEFLNECPGTYSRPAIMRWVKKDGTVIWVEQRLNNICDKNGKVTAVTGVARNISHQKREEFAVRESTQVFKELFYNAPDCIFLHEFRGDALNGRIIVSNERTLSLLEYSQDLLQSLTFKDLIESKSLNLVSNVMESIHVCGKVRYEALFKTRSGRVLPVEINTNITHYKGQKVLLSISRDVSFRHKMEQEAIKNQKLETISILAGGIAHDFNNYLTAIIGNISMAQEMLDNKEELKEFLFQTRKLIMKATDLTQQLLTFSKGGTPIKRLTSIKNTLKETALFSLRGTNIDCNFRINPDIWTVEVDIGQMSQVFNNIVINARQAMSAGGILEVSAENISVEIDEESFIRKGNYVKITFRDTGIGIPQEHLSHVFDPFFTTKEKGSGLGLATSYSIVKRHGGYITLESYIDEGTTFYIYLPALKRVKGDVYNLIGNDLLKGSGRILVLEDQDYIRETLKNMFTILGYESVFSTKGEETIRLYEHAFPEGKPFDLVLMDITIKGGLGGEETMERLLRIDPDIRAIVSSGYSNHPVVANYKIYGFKNVIRKPFTLYELSKVLFDTLAIHKGNN
ncbi:MAG: PAS domain S-box protein [Spirochaetales bacterium]|nr:PAS domain S-box protein [Spirochaetales bacterium]